MGETDSLTLQLLRQIDRKLEALLKKMSSGPHDHRASLHADSLFLRATEIAQLTPRGVRQTDAVQLLHEDRTR